VGLNEATSGLKTGASGLNTGAVTLILDMPSMLVLLLAEAASAGLLRAGVKDEKLEDSDGLKEAAGLNLNSLASTLSFVIEECDVCLLCIAELGFPNASFASLHELLTWDAVLECCAESPVSRTSPSSKLGFVTSELLVLAPSLSPRGFSGVVPNGNIDC